MLLYWPFLCFPLYETAFLAQLESEAPDEENCKTIKRFPLSVRIFWESEAKTELEGHEIYWWRCPWRIKKNKKERKRLQIMMPLWHCEEEGVKEGRYSNHYTVLRRFQPGWWSSQRKEPLQGSQTGQQCLNPNITSYHLVIGWEQPWMVEVGRE